MGFIGSVFSKVILVFAIVLILMLIVFPMLGTTKDDLLGLFKDYKSMKPTKPDKVSILGTNPDGAWIGQYDAGYWQGIDNDLSCIKMGNDCSFTIFFDRNMGTADFSSASVKSNMRVWAGTDKLGTADSPGEWKELEHEKDFKLDLKDGKELIISGLKETDYLIKFPNANLQSKDKKKINEDTRMIIFEID